MEFMMNIPTVLEEAASQSVLKLQKRYCMLEGKLVADYSITTDSDELLFGAIQTINPFFSLKIRVIDKSRKQIGEITYFSAANKCGFFKKAVRVCAPLGNTIGFLLLERRICRKMVKILDEDDELLYIINLGCCYSDLGHYKYKILDAKEKSGGIVTLKAESQMYSFSFPVDASPRDKILILFSAFYIVTVMTGLH